MASDVRSYRDLMVWRRAIAWTTEMYRVTHSWPVDERYGLTSQARRAAVSVAANVAEGAGRRTRGEFLQFLGVARGSLAETETLLIVSGELGLTTEADFNRLLAEADEISRMLAGLIAKLRAKS